MAWSKLSDSTLSHQSATTRRPKCCRLSSRLRAHHALNRDDGARDLARELAVFARFNITLPSFIESRKLKNGKAFQRAPASR